MEKEILKKLVEKYLNDDCTPQETQEINEWYNSFDEAGNLDDGLTTKQLVQLKHRIMSRVKSNISFLEGKTEERNSFRKAPTRKLAYILTGIAATILLVTGLFFYENNYKPTSLNSRHSDLAVVNKTKSIQKVILEDGSLVWLNPNSKIVYPHKFPQAKRELQMEGEAFFEITPDVKRPFIIYSGNIITKVLGTSFFVRAKNGSPAEVSVVTGKVSVRLQEYEGNSEVMLLPDQKVTFSEEANLLKKGRENTNSPVRIWQKASLSFDNVPLSEVIPILNEKFGVTIRTEDEKLLRYTLKADFTNQSLPGILEMLEKSLDIRYEISDQQILLTTK